MCGQTCDHVATIETLGYDVVEQQHKVGHLVVVGQVSHLEVVVGIKFVEVGKHLVVGDVALAETRGLIEY